MSTSRLNGRALYTLYSARFAYRHPLSWDAMHAHERRTWSSLAAYVLDADMLDSQEIPAEAIEVASAALWNVAHEHDSLPVGRTWDTAREDSRFTLHVAHTRWKAETAIRAADDTRRWLDSLKDDPPTDITSAEIVRSIQEGRDERDEQIRRALDRTPEDEAKDGDT